MAVKDILLLGNSLLYQKSEAVQQHEVENLLPHINLLFDTITAFRRKYGTGRAIAAPQTGLLKRIICLNIDNPIEIINPEISDLSENMIELWDDCMSFPNLLVKVKRHKKLTLIFRDRHWKLHTWKVEDDLSELIQHEYDHLNGILATQRAIDKRSFWWKP